MNFLKYNINLLKKSSSDLQKLFKEFDSLNNSKEEKLNTDYLKLQVQMIFTLNSAQNYEENLWIPALDNLKESLLEIKDNKGYRVLIS